MKKSVFRRTGQRGQGLAELALTMPMLILILAGLVHFGFIMQAQQVITNASRVGARRGTQPNGDQGTIQSAVTNYCQQAGLDPSRLSVQVNIDDDASQVSVTVSYQFTSPVEGALLAVAALISAPAQAAGGDTGSLVLPRQLQATTVMRL
jgi:Flp pilus assembly protein TadG